MQMGKKKLRLVLLISDKIDFKTKVIVRDKKWTLHNDKRNNPKREYNPSEHLCT